MALTKKTKIVCTMIYQLYSVASQSNSVQNACFSMRLHVSATQMDLVQGLPRDSSAVNTCRKTGRMYAFLSLGPHSGYCFLQFCYLKGSLTGRTQSQSSIRPVFLQVVERLGRRQVWYHRRNPAQPQGNPTFLVPA